LFEGRGEGTNLRLPESSIITPSPLWGKLLLLHHFTLGVLTSGILKNRVAAITASHGLLVHQMDIKMIFINGV
jgi:hypothetical protein